VTPSARMCISYHHQRGLEASRVSLGKSSPRLVLTSQSLLMRVSFSLSVRM
jgi:hypothetical protein